MEFWSIGVLPEFEDDDEDENELRIT